MRRVKRAIMVAHSEDDDVVPVQYGYDLYYEKYGNNPRFTFLHFEDKGHNDFFFDRNDSYKNEFNAECDNRGLTLFPRFTGAVSLWRKIFQTRLENSSDGLFQLEPAPWAIIYRSEKTHAAGARNERSVNAAV